MSNQNQRIRIKSKFVHIVLSPRECPDPYPLLKYLKEKAFNYVVAREFGTNGHEHLEAYVEFPEEKRQDKVKEVLRKLYPDIPKEEFINVKVSINHLDTDERYGYGYSLKEGNILASTLTPQQELDALYYYNSKKELIQQKISQLQAPKRITLDFIADSLLDCVVAYYKSSRKKLERGENISWLCQEFLYYFTKEHKIPFSLYQKMSKEKLVEYVLDHLIEGQFLLTDPNSVPLENQACTCQPLNCVCS